MNLESHRQADNTREKLRLLEERCRAIAEEPGELTYARKLTLRSFGRMMNQMREELARFESRAAASGRGS
jgi:hypothetical protein